MTRLFKLIEDRSWNDEPIIEHYTGTEKECLEWLHNNTSFSVHEALTNQGYSIIPN